MHIKRPIKGVNLKGVTFRLFYSCFLFIVLFCLILYFISFLFLFHFLTSFIIQCATYQSLPPFLLLQSSLHSTASYMYVFQCYMSYKKVSNGNKCNAYLE